MPLPNFPIKTQLNVKYKQEEKSGLEADQNSVGLAPHPNPLWIEYVLHTPQFLCAGYVPILNSNLFHILHLYIFNRKKKRLLIATSEMHSRPSCTFNTVNIQWTPKVLGQINVWLLWLCTPARWIWNNIIWDKLMNGTINGTNSLACVLE
jgi:hypothetical protein